MIYEAVSVKVNEDFLRCRSLSKNKSIAIKSYLNLTLRLKYVPQGH